MRGGENVHVRNRIIISNNLKRITIIEVLVKFLSHTNSTPKTEAYEPDSFSLTAVNFDWHMQSLFQHLLDSDRGQPHDHSWTRPYRP